MTASSSHLFFSHWLLPQQFVLLMLNITESNKQELYIKGKDMQTKKLEFQAFLFNPFNFTLIL